MTHARSALLALLLLGGCELDRTLIAERPTPTASSLVTSWIGNTSGGADDAWMPSLLSGVFAARDGTVFVSGATPNTISDPATAIVKAGAVVGSLRDVDRGWSRTSGRAITGTRDHVFVAMTQGSPGGSTTNRYPPTGTSWQCVRRYELDGIPAPFAGGGGVDGSMLVVSDQGRIVALATSQDKLFVAIDEPTPVVAIFDLATLSALDRVAMGPVQALAVDAIGRLWTTDGADDGSVIARDAHGNPLGPKIDAPGRVRALAIDREDRLLAGVDVASTERPIVVAYSLGTAPSEVDRFSVPPPAFAANAQARSPGTSLVGIAVDGVGRIYVAENEAPSAGARLVAISDSTHAWLWEAGAQVASDTAAVDPRSDGGDVFTRFGRFRLDLAHTDAVRATPSGWTMDSARYPEDRRLGVDNDARTIISIVGKQALLIQASADIAVYRLSDDGVAAPIAKLGRGTAPAADDVSSAPAWIWQDDNGDGLAQAGEYRSLDAGTRSTWADAKGTFWRIADDRTVRSLPATLSSSGAVRYDVDGERRVPMPPEFQQMQQLQTGESDSVFISGFTADRPNPYGDAAWTTSGTEIIRYDDWSSKPRLRWRIPIAEATPTTHRPCGFAVAGDRAFVAYGIDDRGIRVWDARTGETIGLLEPDGSINPSLSMCRRLQPLTAWARRNGEILLFAGDPVHAKVTLFRLPPAWRP